MPSAPTETTALLADCGTESIRRTISRESYKANTPSQPEDEEALIPNEAHLEDTTTWRQETILLARYALPLMVTYLLQYTYNLLIVYMSGLLGSEELAAASIATMTANITGMVVYEALASCLDTLASQAYGSGNKEMVGVHVQRMIMLSLISTVPIGAVWFSSPWFLPRMIPQQDIARLAGKFLRFYLIGAPGYGIFEAAKRFTQSQGNFTAPLVVQLICVPLNIFLNWFLVIHLSLGFEGIACAAAIGMNLQPLVLFLYIYFFAPSTWQCWPGIKWSRIFHNWGPMVRLAIPSLVMLLSEWFAFEVLTFATSYLGAKQLAAQTVLMTIGVAMFHIPFPTSIAASTRFGNLIGAGKLNTARSMFSLYYVIFIAIGIFDIVLLVSLRNVIPKIFTDDEEVRALIADILPLLAIMQFTDATTAISAGLLRGLGKQAMGGYINVAAHYLVGVPFAMLLAFGPSHLGMVGLWIGPCFGLAFATIAMFFYMRCTSWETAVEEAKARDE